MDPSPGPLLELEMVQMADQMMGQLIGDSQNEEVMEEDRGSAIMVNEASSSIGPPHLRLGQGADREISIDNQVVLEDNQMPNQTEIVVQGNQMPNQAEIAVQGIQLSNLTHSGLNQVVASQN